MKRFLIFGLVIIAISSATFAHNSNGSSIGITTISSK